LLLIDQSQENLHIYFMTKLSRYIASQFAIQTLALFFVATLLVWITQTLRLFDVVTAKGQDMFTLIGQATLTTPRLSMAIIYICMGIGIARAMRAFQASKELHTIHSTNRLSALYSALVVFIFSGMAITTLIANWVEPLSNRAYAKWNEEVAADLVGRALNPNKFSEIVPGLVIVIGDRQADGTIVNFFADDKRDKKTQKTYIAKKAEILFDEKGYNISLIDGSMQFKQSDNQLSVISFNRYDLSLDKLINESNSSKTINETDSFSLFIGKLNSTAKKELRERFSETLRVLALCLFVAAISIFPNARRGKKIFPIEITVLLIGLGERAISVSLSKTLATAQYSSGLILLIVAILIFLYRFNAHKLVISKGAKHEFS